MVGWLRTSLSRSNFKKLVTSRYSRSSMCTSSDDVLFETVNDKAIITLNRPKALNALSLNMVRLIYPQLKALEQDGRINAVIIKGAGDKAFCAGGDIRALLEQTPDGLHLRVNFFKEEYMLNNAIGTLDIPYIALINGITMGGGVGLSVHGLYRVATEKTIFAMPETAIGLFPDVGGSYFLSRLGDHLGVYLALTGYRLKGSDVQKAGVATHYVTSDKLLLLEKELLNMKMTNPSTIGKLLDSFQELCQDKSDFVLAPYMEKISRCFGGATAEQIMERLRKDDSDWAQKQIGTLNKMSPTSVKVALRQIQEGGEKNLQECFQMEYRLSQRFMEDHDFFEGVRAVLVDRDNKPEWKPATFEEVTNDAVDHYFSPLPKERELQL